ncbi:amidohydrolase family protein [uncultured Ruegeria sp.]|uniref:amidohydrolase family protein n=1 Tax=uncultured Ruegeria sp. TaxID=259304 RepID=UPI0026166892|nr:amidohydrolase family protein [uncultured Ruegeria sp.]
MSKPAMIDAHQHFWQIARGDYDWMTDEVAAIRHDILPRDLEPHLRQHKIDGTVLVQAAGAVAETEFMVSLSRQAHFIKGVVGWVDLEDANVAATLDRLTKNTVLKGIRPMLQDIEDTDWILRPHVMEALKQVADRGLRLDALVVPRHLDVLAAMAECLPNLRIVIDHCAKPVIAGGVDPGNAWRDGMERLAALPNTYCKISGLANEAGPGWNADWLSPVVNHVLSTFGASRLMWGSDWPVLNLAGDYTRWRDVSTQLLGHLPADAQAAIYGGTATGFYGLDTTE